MLLTGNDLQLQFLRETDFGSVIAVESHVLEDGKEIALHLGVAAFGFPQGRSLLSLRAGKGGSRVHGTQKDELLGRRSGSKVFAEERVALFVHIGETVEEIASLFAVSPFGEHDVEEL